jgi:hypothetical protein
VRMLECHWRQAVGGARGVETIKDPISIRLQPTDRWVSAADVRLQPRTRLNGTSYFSVLSPRASLLTEMLTVVPGDCGERC